MKDESHSPPVRPRWILRYAAGAILGVPAFFLLPSVLLDAVGIHTPSDWLIEALDGLSRLPLFGSWIADHGLAAMPMLVTVQGTIFGLVVVVLCHLIWLVRSSRVQKPSG